MTSFQTIDIYQEHRIAASPETVFRMLTTQIGDWWREPYRLGNNDSEIRLDPVPGGALAEYWGEGGFAVWGTLTRYESNRVIVFNGACGMSGGVQGEFGFEVDAEGDGTLLRLSHIASGLIDDSTRVGYGVGWTKMLGQLKVLAERDLGTTNSTP